MDGDIFRSAHSAERGVKALNGGPGTTAGKRVVHLGGVLEVAEAGLEQVFLRGGVAACRFARDEPLSFQGRHAPVKDEAVAREAADAVLALLAPFQKSRTLRSMTTLRL